MSDLKKFQHLPKVVIDITGPDLFNFQQAQEARDEAIDAVEEARHQWHLLAVSAIEAVSLGASPIGGHTFTSDDVLRYEPELEECPEKRVLGAAFRELSRAKIIEPTGRYISSSRRASHCRPKREWRRKWSAKM